MLISPFAISQGPTTTPLHQKKKPFIPYFHGILQLIALLLLLISRRSALVAILSAREASNSDADRVDYLPHIGGAGAGIQGPVNKPKYIDLIIPSLPTVIESQPTAHSRKTYPRVRDNHLHRPDQHIQRYTENKQHPCQPWHHRYVFISGAAKLSDHCQNLLFR